MQKNNLKYYLIAITFTVCLFLGLRHFSVLANIARYTLKILAPFLMGFAFAFILNGPANWFEAKFRKSKKPFIQKKARPIAVNITLIITAICILFTIFALIPQLIESSTILVQNMPTYISELRALFDKFMAKVDMPTDIVTNANTAFSTVSKSAETYLKQLAPALASSVVDIGTNIVNVFLGAVIAIQILYDSDKMSNQVRRITYAFLPEKKAQSAEELASLTAKFFHSYFTVQFLNGIIIGVASVIALYIFQFPYASLIGVFLGITSMIPVFGPFIGAIPSFLVIAMADPMKGVWFVVLVVVIQTIVSNFVTPYLMSEKLEIPGLWIMVSVIIGGSLFGFIGMIIATPLFAVFYTCVKRETIKRENAKLAAKQSPPPALPATTSAGKLPPPSDKS